MGLSFSVPKDIKTPPSLKNIYTELTRDPKITGFKAPDHGCLQKWAEHGILLLNATLTVEYVSKTVHAIGFNCFLAMSDFRVTHWDIRSYKYVPEILENSLSSFK